MFKDTIQWTIARQRTFRAGRIARTNCTATIAFQKNTSKNVELDVASRPT